MFYSINTKYDAAMFTHYIYMVESDLTLTVLVTTIDALQHFETG